MALTRRALLEGTAATAVTFGTPTLAATATQDAVLAAMFDRLSEELLAAAPPLATYLGLDNGARAGLKSRLADSAWSAIQASHQMCTDWLGKLNAIPAARLSTASALNRDIVTYALALARTPGFSIMAITRSTAR